MRLLPGIPGTGCRMMLNVKRWHSRMIPKN
jgi:hypothetical protein